MVFDEVMRAVAVMSDEELRTLRQRIDQLPEQAARLTPKEKTLRLNAALDKLGAGLNQAQFDEMTAAMTEDYITAWDESEWTQ